MHYARQLTVDLESSTLKSSNTTPQTFLPSSRLTTWGLTCKDGHISHLLALHFVLPCVACSFWPHSLLACWTCGFLPSAQRLSESRQLPFTRLAAYRKPPLNAIRARIPKSSPLGGVIGLYSVLSLSTDGQDTLVLRPTKTSDIPFVGECFPDHFDTFLQACGLTYHSSHGTNQSSNGSLNNGLAVACGIASCLVRGCCCTFTDSVLDGSQRSCHPRCNLYQRR